MQQLHETADLVPESLAKRLRAATHDTHEILDKRIMNADPFRSQERYGLFVKMQHGFHRDIDALYDDPQLDALLPDLQGRRRLSLIEQDLADLDIEAISFDMPPAFAAGAAIDLPTALGWLYVAEGSNMGAAFLLKWAKEKLELSESFGARHLAGAPEGRGLHWRTFTAAFDAANLNDDEELRAVEGARQAFSRVMSLVEQAFYR